MERMLEFYCTGLAFQILSDGAWRDNQRADDVVGLTKSAARVVMINAGNILIELFEYSAPHPKTAEPLTPSDYGYTHICFDVTDAEAEWERLSHLGMTFSRRPVDLGFIKCIYGKDPDGNIIEIMEVVDQDHPTAFKNLKIRVESNVGIVP
jgi:catechol 2,3-dioxygenase-like lactoylglutathione lyase family enzyme